jgi:formylglycine-generating enzyme required for sulfatase activity
MPAGSDHRFMLNRDLFKKITDLLLPAMNDGAERKALIESALIGSTVLDKIQWDGSARTFVTRVAKQLDEFGEIEKGRPALVVLLEEFRGQVGANVQAEIDAVLAQLAAPAAIPVPLPEKVFDDEELYIFLSYARPDEAAAAQIEAFLTAAGIRVFRDTSDINAGENWDLAIEKALDECRCMVLLLSAASMPDRKEVHREWFNFDQKRKMIYPLYLRDCKLHSRFDSRNYIDAREGLPAALDQLLAALRKDFKLSASSETAVAPQPVTPAQAVESLLAAIRQNSEEPSVSIELANLIKEHKPTDIPAFRACRIAEWSLPRYYLDKRFVNLTLLLDKGETEQQRWQRAEDYRFKDLREVLDKAQTDPVLALLGAPGSGKSTLLRRLQLDHSIDRLRDGGEQISFFIQLNGYRTKLNGDSPDPREWLGARWGSLYPQLPPLDDYLRQGRALLLLDALNEMPHRSTADYHRLVDLWRGFAQEAAHQGNRILFSCRSLDYSASLSSPDLRVPQVEVQPMNAEQVQEFLQAYAPAHKERIWKDLDGSPQFGLFQTPYFLKLLCEQVEATGEAPKGRAALFTGFVRQALQREINGKLFQLEGGLLARSDHEKLSRGVWRDPFELPDRGSLIPKLCKLAYAMQVRGFETEGAQVRIHYDDACDLMAHAQAEDFLDAGISLNVLDKDLTQYEIAFFHQLLQEYFAARQLAREPKPDLVHVEWTTDEARPKLDEVLAGLADGDPLPPLPQTGWEETCLTAAPMAKDPDAFIRALLPHNLPLAARCAASPEVRIREELKDEIRRELITRTQKKTADLRAKIAAGEALGIIGDPRFERKSGPYGEYLMPPMVEIPGGTYPIGDDEGEYDREKPAHTVELDSFQIGRFPVTNAEYKCFLDAKGYEDEQWWDTEEAKAWLRGEASIEGSKQQWRENRKLFQSLSEDQIHDSVTQNRITSQQANDYIVIRNWPDERFEEWLDENFPSGKVSRKPEFWEDTRFNNPSQPVVGVTWFEARAYCNWLTSTVGIQDQAFRLPTEIEFEAATRGSKGRAYPYGNKFDLTRCNTFESHIRRSTPVGIFGNATPEGVFDLSGNAYTWTLSIYDEQQFPYPYKKDDGREDIHQTGVRRVLRGGSWFDDPLDARAVCRSNGHPAARYDNISFRVVGCVRPTPP